jgi:serine phosphatase RsbU (regulator of sigma subunit)
VEKARRDKEYERAKIVQQTIFTSQEEYRLIGGVDIDVMFLPRNDRVSGDYYNILSAGEGQAAFLIADASGHGIQAALSTMQLDLLFKQGLAVSDIARRMEYLNKMLADELHSQNFCTAFAMRLEQRRIQYTSAGHPPQYLVRAGGSEVVALKTPGIPLGIYGDRRYVNGEQVVGPGDILVLFTDGLFEECNARGEIWGEERLLDAILKLAASPEMSMADFNGWLIHELRSFLGRKSFEDDLTLISVRVR